MPSSDLAQYKPLFLQTAWDYLRQLESSLAILHAEPKNAEAVEISYISAHSLKSQSSVMGYEKLATLCLHLEEFFRHVKEGKKQLGENEMTVLGQVLEDLKHALATISAEDKDTELDLHVPALRSLMDTEDDET